MQSGHPLSLLSYIPTELPALHCVAPYIFSSPFSWPFFQHPSSLLEWLAQGTADCSKVVAIVAQTPAQETALHPPHLSIFPATQWHAYEKCVIS